MGHGSPHINNYTIACILIRSLLDHHWPIRQSLVLEQLTQRNITHALSKQNLELIVMKLV